MSTCPECGSEKEAITQDADDGQVYALCENGHTWPDDGPDDS